MIDTILVPQGAEYRAVCRGCPPSLGSDQSKLELIPIPIGPEALRCYLTDRLSTRAFQPGSKVLVLGLCGSLTACFDVGNAVIYQACVNGASATLPSLPCEVGLTQDLSQLFQPSLQLVTALTSDRLIHVATEKQSLGHATQAEVVDMEGYTILEVLRQAGVAVAMIRVVSDGIERDLPDLTAAFGKDGSLRPLSLAWGMIQRPIAASYLIQGSLRGLSVLSKAATIVTGGLSTHG